jgi:enoyl-CoA hydratase
MEYDNIRYEKNKGIGTITLNRPAGLNPLSKEMLQDIFSAIEEVKNDEEVRAVIMTGAGDRAFSAGADIKTMQSMTSKDMKEYSQIGHKVCSAIEELEKPVIASINGFALGGGLELAMACDIRIASAGSRLGQPEINLGLIPVFGGTQRLPKLVGKGAANEMILTGKHIDAKTAERLGLVNLVVTAYPGSRGRQQMKAAAEDIANEIIKKSPISVKLAKKLINSSLETKMEEGIAMEIEASETISSTEDFKEGVKAFLERREPQFKGK